VGRGAPGDVHHDLIPTLILYFAFQRQFVQGITLGSIRG
jgi:ABC-type maltose transport system permease subunit